MSDALRDFKEFVLKGDVVALAVAVIIATAFGAVIASFVANVITPLIAAIGGQPDFSQLDFTINGSRFGYGNFVNAIFTFVIIAAALCGWLRSCCESHGDAAVCHQASCHDRERMIAERQPYMACLQNRIEIFDASSIRSQK